MVFLRANFFLKPGKEAYIGKARGISEEKCISMDNEIIGHIHPLYGI